VKQPTRPQLERRAKNLLILAWASILLPLAAFVYFTVQAYELKQQTRGLQVDLDEKQEELAGAERRRSDLDAKLKELDRELAEKQRNLEHYRQFAGIRIRYYRPTDAEIIGKVGATLGIPTQLGQSPLINVKPNAVVFGDEVSEQDYRDIAVALIAAGFPLKSIRPATRNQDPKLIQIIASGPADRECALLTPDQVKQGQTCGTRG
jgi:hypothetical protein